MSIDEAEYAPGWPGIEARWTSSAKSGVGAALSAAGRVWFTISHGILNEVYYPRIDQACTRDLGLIVTDRGGEFFSEEKRHASHRIAALADGVPCFRISNTCLSGRYAISKEIIADPKREVILQQIEFHALQGTIEEYAVYALLAPHLGNRGSGNNAWLGDFKGQPMLFAERDGTALALACSAGWEARSVGFVGVSDGWQDLQRHNKMEWRYRRAHNGNVGMTGQIDIGTTQGRFTLALGFGRTWAEAAHRAAASLQDGFGSAAAKYRRTWEDWQRGLRRNDIPSARARDLYRVSTAVLRTHESARFPGAIVASLSIPWGFAKGDGDLGGYHLVWPRDLAESAGGLLAAGAVKEVLRVLRYFSVTQESDGHWPQNMWLDGTPYWQGVQMDETGFPILLVDLVRRKGALDDEQLCSLWPMVRRAAAFLVRNGPVTQQDRWEEDAGYSPFTLAVEVAALLCAADIARTCEPALADYLCEIADAWNAAIERWTYVTGTDLAEQFGVEGYYVRIAPPDKADAASPSDGYVPIKNRPPGQSSELARHIISPDALALVRFGLRAADDPRILNTLAVIDALLKIRTPAGPLWYRYNGDGYGEHDDGAPFDGTGVGRPWPLLTAERAHYEIAAGRRDRAESLLETLTQVVSDGGLLPEQVWDAGDIPQRELVFGKPSGSAMPLVWAHAEFVKLCRSLADGAVFDMPPQPVERYIVKHMDAAHVLWRFTQKCVTMPAGKVLRIEVAEPALVHWSTDGWITVTDSATRDSGLGLHMVDLKPEDGAARFDFTFYWRQAGRWEGRDFTVAVVPELSC